MNANGKPFDFVKASGRNLPLQIAVCVLAAVALFCLAAAVSGPSAADVRSVSVSGSGAVQVAPDRATIRLSVVTRDSSVSAAAAKNADTMAAVRDAVSALAAGEDALFTSDYRIYQESAYDGGRNIPGDYRVSNMLTVVLDDTEKAGAAIDAAIAAGANELSSLEFSVSDTTGAVSQARALAMEQARRSAEELASASGARIGRVLSVAEENYGRPVYASNARLASADMAAGTPVSAGKTDVTVTVHAVFELK